MKLSLLMLTVSCFTPGKLLFEGDNCTLTETFNNGLCININQCDYGKKLLETKKNPQFCESNGTTALVCCPFLKKIIQPGKLSRQMCGEYFKKIDLRIFDNYIVPALPGEFTHMAAVGFVDNSTNNILWLCGGSLISPYFILTAAHCTYSSAYGPPIWIQLGLVDLSNSTSSAIKINETYVHPLYKLSSYDHDIALFKLEHESLETPVCLHTEKNIPDKTLGVTGWGQLGFSGETSNSLMKADLKLVDFSKCSKKYAKYARFSSQRLKHGIRDKYQICAGDEFGGDTCPGDSGGPLHYAVTEDDPIAPHFVLVGVTSFGSSCGGSNSAGVYTRVSAYLEWIEMIVWENETHPEEIETF